MPVSLNGSHSVRDTASIDEGELCTDYSLLHVYANREQYDSSQNIINMNFVQFGTTYKVVNNELTKLPENVIPRIFPTYSPNPKGPNFGLYCKYQGINRGILGINRGEQSKIMHGVTKNQLTRF